MTTVIIDYESGNLRSAEKSFQRMAAETGAGPVLVTADPEDVLNADRIVLPGVGAFADCRAGLDAIPGMVDALEDRVIQQRHAISGDLRRPAIDVFDGARAWRRRSGLRLDPG